MEDENHRFKYFERIQDYLAGELSEEDVALFENELKHNELLRDEFDLYQSIHHGIKVHNITQFKQAFSAIDDELDQQEAPIIQTNFSRVLKLAIGSVAASILIAFIIYFFQDDSANQQLAATYWEEDRGVPSLMGQTTNLSLNEAMYLYKEGDYATAMKRINSLKETHPQNDTLIYYAGIISYKLENYRSAIHAFKRISAHSVYHEKAEFRLAIVYLAFDKPKACIQVLNTILSDPYHLYFHQAKKLSKALEN